MTLLDRGDPLFDKIYEVLWAKILAGEIPRGSRVSDLEWSAKLNVSRTPVREAMRKLQQDGILLPLSRTGYEIRRMERSDLDGLYRCRAVLEGLAVHDAIPHLSKGQRDNLSLMVDQTRRALKNKDFNLAFKLNTQFHDILVEASCNPHLLTLLKRLRRMILFARSSLMGAAHHSDFTHSYSVHLLKTQTDHKEILALIGMGDAEGASKRMQTHILSTAEDMKLLASKLPGGAGSDRLKDDVPTVPTSSPLLPNS